MKVLTFVLLIAGMSFWEAGAQTTTVKGRVVDSYTIEPIAGVEVAIVLSNFNALTDPDGRFTISDTGITPGEQLLSIAKEGYVSKKIRINIEPGHVVNLDPLLFQADLTSIQDQIGLISLTDYELDQDEDVTSNISGLLQASNDVFLNAAAYDFSATFFKPRGLDNSNSKLLINGIEMNKFNDGRPQWGNWGGLNDVQRNREFSMGTKANGYGFGGIAGTTQLTMRASKYKRGGRVSYAIANRSYEGRVMGSYSSGHTKNNWAYTVLISRRFGQRGYVEGTPYDANSAFIAVEKKLADAHHINFAAFYTPVLRGRSTALTEEVYNLKGRIYNPNWGYQEGKIRSSRLRRIEQPTAVLSYFWDISQRSHINLNAGWQFGEIGNTRLDYGGIRNPAANYYQRLPSYFLRSEDPTAYDFRLAYDAREQFVNDGQLNWESFYRANSGTMDGNSIYAIQEDIMKENFITVNAIFRSNPTDRITLNSKLTYRSLKSENFAMLKDLLGGKGYLDIDTFGDDPNQIQNDIENPDRIAREGERYKYNYQFDATEISAFTQAQFDLGNTDFYLGGRIAQTGYQRTGIYRNGYFPENNRSIGKSDAVRLLEIAGKAGITYQISGRHLLDLNLAYQSQPPVLRNTFSNPRQNNDVVVGLLPERNHLADLSYLFRSSRLKARFTAFYSELVDQTDIGFFFTQNALGSEDNSAFVQEIVTGISSRNAGFELGIEAQILPSFKFKAAASMGQYVFTSNADLYLSGDDFDIDLTDDMVDGNDLSALGKRQVSLKNYHVPRGPEQAYQVGIEYRDPTFWWIGGTVNHFSNAFVDISYLRRTSDFYTDRDGLPFNDYDTDIARTLLKQEKLGDYILVNLIGGKSWRVKQYFVGFFASVNNLLDTNYRTGGFEDSRRVSYRQRLEEEKREYGPLFGNRYFFGNGPTYYLNLYVRF